MVGFYEFNLPVPILQRGFWLYAWKVLGPSDQKLCYVGMTGDVNGSAQSPYVRAGAHLGSNRHSNALRTGLKKHFIEPESCKALEFAAYGPIFEYIPDHAEHQDKRKLVGKLERKLWEEAEASGMSMLNGKPQFADDFDRQKWDEVRKAFAGYLSFKT